MNIIDSKKLDYALDFILKRIEQNMKTYSIVFPPPQSNNYRYGVYPNYEWTPSFWTGMLWLAYELTGEEKFKHGAQIQMQSYRDRLIHKVFINTHDIGFIYSLSCVASYKLTGNEYDMETAIMAADHLITRYNEKGRFIQAWGDVGESGNCRLIIDCLLNIPFLFWATEVTGDDKYKFVAENHLRTALSVLTRPDYTTHHTYFFSSKTGEPLYGKTSQGASDGSCWARGQAWGVAGTAFNYKYVPEDFVFEKHTKITDTFVNRLPKDNVPYWDMDFSPEDNEPRDTSASAIAACGILEMNKFHKNEAHLSAVSNMLTSLIDNYLTENIKGANGILSDGMYSRPGGCKPESVIWGDYFFFEALTRIKKPEINLYW